MQAIVTYPQQALAQAIVLSNEVLKRPLALALALGSVIAISVTAQMSFNMWFMILATLGLVVALSKSFYSATMYCLVYYALKPAYWRLAYHFDKTYGSLPTIDLLRFSAGMFLVLICCIIIVKHFNEHKSLCQNKLDVLVMLFIGLNFVSILNPYGSIFVGMAGFERTVFPTVFLFFIGREIFATPRRWEIFFKTVTIIGLFAVLYGLKHALSGIWGFETTFFTDFFNNRGFDGWLTVGIHGVEFRNFSIFFTYMEFTFTLALWMIFVLSHDFSRYSRSWRLAKWSFGILGFLLLGITMERTPLLMVLIGLAVASYVIADRNKRKRMLFYVGALIVVILSIVTTFQEELENSGIAKLERLSEIADPTAAASINDRIERKWAPTLNIIASHPLGVGVGYGSETIASASVAGTSYRVQPHNEILQKALETGIPGAILFLCILVGAWLRLYRNGNSAINLVTKRTLAAMCGIMAAFFMCGQINLPYSGAQGIWFWFTLGSVLSLTGKSKSIEKPEVSE